MKDLEYIGDGRFLAGIPDTDLGVDDIAALAAQRGVAAADLFERLTKSGLYQPKKPSSKPSAPAES